MKQMFIKDVDKAMKNIANYYRNSRLYTYLLNTEDAYQAYIDAYTEDTKLLVEQGHSYWLKNEFLIGVRLDVFAEEHPEAFHHYFDCIYSAMQASIDKEPNDVIFICAIGPSKDCFTADTYKLVKEFVDKYSEQYTVLTDCPVEIDFKNFPKYTGSSLIRLAGREYFRWPRRK